MPKNIERIKVEGREIIFLGTAHVSKASVSQVRKVIREEKPDVVAVELCQERYRAMRHEQKWDETSIVDVIKKGRSGLLLLNALMAGLQRRLGKRLGVQPGAEMMAAVRAGERMKADVVLADRDVQLTLKRAWSSLSLVEKAKLSVGMVAGLFETDVDEEFVESLKEGDVLTSVIEDLSREMPSAKKVLIDERDEHLAAKILGHAGKKTVAVVGAGHLKGVKKNIEKLSSNKTVRLARLYKVSKPGWDWKKLAYLIPLIFLALIAYGFTTHGAELTITMLWMWLLINGGLAALGAALALAHPLTIASAFLAAPLTSLNPALAAGWVAGLVEAWVRQPRVKDFRKLALIDSLGSLWRNRVTRILLVVVLSNIGSSIGTFIALPYLATLL